MRPASPIWMRNGPATAASPAACGPARRELDHLAAAPAPGLATAHGTGPARRRRIRGVAAAAERREQPVARLGEAAEGGRPALHVLQRFLVRLARDGQRRPR